MTIKNKPGVGGLATGAIAAGRSVKRKDKKNQSVSAIATAGSETEGRQEAVPIEGKSTETDGSVERLKPSIWESIEDKWMRKGTEPERPITLPNGAVLNFHLALIDPTKTFPSEANGRVQELLSFDDPDVLELYRSIEKIGQSEPILLNKQNDGQYEVIYGTRRRFAVTRLHEEYLLKGERGFPLLAYVAPNHIMPSDVEALAEAENNIRQDLSVYEKAVRCALLMSKGEGNQSIARRLNVHEKRVPIYKRLAEIPSEIVTLLESPKLLTVSAGEKLVSRKEELGGWSEVLKSINNSERKFSTVEELVKLIPRKVARSNKPALKARGKTEITNSEGKVKFSYSWAQNKVGKQLKIDAFDLTEHELERLIESLNQLSAGKK